MPLIDPAAPDYALVVLTLVESILEDPGHHPAQATRQGEDPGHGGDEDARVSTMTSGWRNWRSWNIPKPNRDFIYSTFNAFAARHPWVGQENIRPKSIAREMFEEFRSFADYIKDLRIAAGGRACCCGISRMCTRCWRRRFRTRRRMIRVREMEMYLGDDAEAGRFKPAGRVGENAGSEPCAGRGEEVRPPGAEEADITRDTKAFTAAIRTRVFTFLRGLVIGDWDEALAVLASGEDALGEMWTAGRLREAVGGHAVGHQRISLDPEARNARHTYVTVSEDKREWRVQQMLVDPEGHNDWVAEFRGGPCGVEGAGEPLLRLGRLGGLV